MWKQLSRGVRSSLERCSLFCNQKDAGIAQDPQIQTRASSTCRLRLLPCVVESFFRKQPIVERKHGAGIGEHRKEKDNRDENCNTSSNYGQQYTFLGAVGWVSYNKVEYFSTIK